MAERAEIDGYEGDLFGVSEWIACCEAGLFIDYDGFGHLVKDGELLRSDQDGRPVRIYPTTRDEIPADATHVLWYNK